MMKHALALLLLISSLCGGETPAFVPLPAKVELSEGRFRLDAATAIQASAELTNEAEHLASRLRRSSGLPLPMTAAGNISLGIDTKLAAEGYTLSITASSVSIRGGSPAGVFYGVQTFLQALPAAALGRELAPKADWSAPCLRVEDAPTCSWRGVHLDSSRHFQPKAFILKFLDAMAAQKLNRFHWHLVDSEGWRLEIKKYPRLTQVSEDYPAYYPEEIPTNPTFRAKYRYGHLHGGGFYTKEDVREIVAHAAKLHIVIVPEIEFPGHAMAAMMAYPEISTTGKPPTVVSNITTDLIGVHPKAITFLKDVLDETMELFPGKWIHFGGDEAPKQQWKSDAYTQRKIDELGLRGGAQSPEDALQAWLFNEMSAHIGKRGRVPVGWEEIMHHGNLTRLAKGSVIMPWLSTANAIASANAGYGVVYTSVGPFYLDSYQVGTPGEPSALYAGPTTAESIHRYNLFPAGLTETGRANVLGAQCQLWTELMPRTDDVEYQAYPRLCALAELTWTSPERRSDTAGFMLRLSEHGARLTALGLNHRRVAPPATLSWSPEFLSAGKPWVSVLSPAAADSLRSGKPLTVTFQYRSGEHGLDIVSVELLADGKVVATDRHEGFTGTHPKNPDYRVSLPKGTSGQLSLRISAKGAGGNDSRGEIILK
ncbi:MAG: beta-N-acetylhexosaminidase [Opitutales bacterium]